MTKKDYELIAETIRGLEVSQLVRERIALQFGQALSGTNPLFDHGRFLDAAITPKEES